MLQITACGGGWCKMAESVVKYSYNGTEYSFVSKDPAQIEDLKCPICLQLVYEPVLTSCGHLFCQRCVKGQTKCPTCRDKLQCMRNQRDERKVKSLKVKCPNWKKGCRWQGDLRDTPQHKVTNCQMQTVSCPKGCKEKIVRGRLQEHGKTCPQRAYKCPHCQFPGTFVKVTTTHFTACYSFPLTCPAGCRNRFPRMKIASHLAECAEELVPCMYASIGCQEVIRRRQFQAHMDDKKDYHFQRAMEMVMQLGMAVTELSMSMRLIVTGGATPDTSLLPLPFRPWLQITPTCYPQPPWVFKFMAVQDIRGNEVWFSDPVYSHFGGYKMCIKAYIGDEKPTHVSVSIHLMQGENDDNLKWPFKGTIKVSLLNQLEDRQHFTRQVWSPDCRIPEYISGRVTGRDKAVNGWRVDDFIPQQDLVYNSYKNCQYLKDNTVFCRVDCFKPKLLD